MTEEQAIERIDAAIRRTLPRPHLWSDAPAKAAWNEIKAIAREDEQRVRLEATKAVRELSGTYYAPNLPIWATKDDYKAAQQ